MNKPSETHKLKGISVDRFWRQLKDKTTQKDSQPHAINSRDVSDTNREFLELSDPKENWESRFDEWLDRL